MTRSGDGTATLESGEKKILVEFRFGELYDCARCGERHCVQLGLDYQCDYLHCLVCGAVTYLDLLPVPTRVVKVTGRIPNGI